MNKLVKHGLVVVPKTKDKTVQHTELLPTLFLTPAIYSLMVNLSLLVKAGDRTLKVNVQNTQETFINLLVTQPVSYTHLLSESVFP